MQPPADLAEAFRRHGLRSTPQRRCIAAALEGDETHPTAEAVHERVLATMPSVSLRTVYQTLNDLVALGELRALALGTGSARFDPNVDAHQHVVCTGCGMVRDVYVDGGVPRPPSPAGFVVTSTDVVHRGLCPACVGGPPHDPSNVHEHKEPHPWQT